MKLLNTSYIEIKKSKFYGYLYELDSIENVKIILNNLKEENKGYSTRPDKTLCTTTKAERVCIQSRQLSTARTGSQLLV